MKTVYDEIVLDMNVAPVIIELPYRVVNDVSSCR